MTKNFAGATISTAPTRDDLDGLDATIRRGHTTKRTVTSTEGDRAGSHRRGAAVIIATTKI